MMKRIHTLITGTLLFVFLFSSCSKDNITYEPLSNQIQDNLQTLADQMIRDYRAEYPGFPGGILLKVISPKGNYFVSSGMDPGITDRYHFRAASNNKVFTSTAILLLAQEGKINLDAKMTDTIPGTTMTYLPQEAQYNIPYKDQITIRLLLEHNAGVFDVSNNLIPDTLSVSVPYKGEWYIGYILDQDKYHTFTFDELAGVVSTCRLFFFPPGQGHHYSNTGYSLLGKIIERVSGISYPQFISGRILLPMGLTETSIPFLGTDQMLPSPFIRGYRYAPSVTECTESNISANVAEGSLISTPDDLARFLHKLLRGEGVLTNIYVNGIMLIIPKVPFDVQNYALGINFSQNLGWGHAGSHEGYYSRMVSDPAKGITIVALVNSWTDLPDAEMPLLMKMEETCYKARYMVE